MSILLRSKKVTVLILSLLALGVLIYLIFSLPPIFTKPEKEITTPQAIPQRRPLEEIIKQETAQKPYSIRTGSVEEIKGNTVKISGLTVTLKSPIKVLKDEGQKRDEETTLVDLKVGDVVNAAYVEDNVTEILFLKILRP